MAKKLESLAEIAEFKIVNMIIAGHLKLGSRVTEAELAEKLSISTAPVHQALQALNRLGVVIIKPRKGTYIFTFTKEDICKMTLARYAIESEALRQAHVNSSTRFSLELSRVISRMEESVRQGDLTGYLKYDAEFHDVFYKYSENDFLVMASSAITIKVMVLWYLSILDKYTVGDMLLSFGDHQAIYEKVVVGEIDQACKILSLHLKRLEDIFSREK